MYESHYGLTAKPFSIVPNPELLFLSKNHANALTYLEYGLSEKAGFILLTGEIGAGKTTLVRHLLNQMQSGIETAVIFNTNFSSDQLLRRILSEFEINCDTLEKEGHLAQLYQFLIDRYAMGRHVLLIIDEAQNLTDEALEDIRMLSNLQTDDQILLQVMLVGQPELRERLKMPEFRQLAQRIAVNYHISPLDREQTRHYIKYRIEKAAGNPALFSHEAIDSIYAHSAGIPRTINLICDTALVYGFADNLMQIDAAVVEKVVDDDICMTVSNRKKDSRTFKRVMSKTEAGPGIMERIHSLETSLAELKQQHEDFTQAVKNDLLKKYQQLLTMEQHRYDQLLDKYTRLLCPHPPAEISDIDDTEPEESAKPPLKVRSGTKFTRLMEMANDEKAMDVGELRFSGFIGEEIGGQNREG